MTENGKLMNKMGFVYILTNKNNTVREKCNKFVSRVKKYLSIYLDPYSGKWGLYGFESRERKE